MAHATIPEDDLAFREDVLAYLTTRYHRAVTTLRDGQWDAFRSFVSHWLDTFDWRDENALVRYLALASEARRQRFERFLKQAESWDVTLDFPVGDRATHESAERARWRQQFERQRERFRQRERERHDAWEAVRRFLEAENRLRHMPESLREAYRALGLNPACSLADARQRYRDLAKKLHPDVSGRHEEMAAVNAAWEKVLAFFVS